jgi:hypothetical protein
LILSKIKPIPKGDETDILNYRPIATLPVFSKILEKIMCKGLNSFIKKNRYFQMLNLDSEKQNQSNMPATYF